MSREVTVRGIVVGRRAVGEGSLRVSLYTDGLGLLSALGKSAREERSKLRAHLQEGTFGIYTVVKGRDVWRMTGAYGTHNAFYMTARREHREALSRVLMTVRQFIRGEGSDPYLFAVLFGFITALPNIPTEQVKDAECIVVLRILSALGYVEPANGVARYLTSTYDGAMLSHAKEYRQSLVRTINDSIAASGMG